MADEELDFSAEVENEILEISDGILETQENEASILILNNSQETNDPKNEINLHHNNDEELDAILEEVKKIEKEAESLAIRREKLEEKARNDQSIAEKQMESDQRSIYVGNVDYGTTADELHEYFSGCGEITRATIPVNKPDNHPKGFAYIEFSNMDSIQAALALNCTIFRNRIIKVMLKRTNRPGYSQANRHTRSRGAVYGNHNTFKSPRNYLPLSYYGYHGYSAPY